jgi:hypothetical protein
MAEWHELLIEGPEKVVRAFVCGFMVGAGKVSGGIFGHDLPLETESLGERLKNLITARSHQMFFAPRSLAEPLARALKEHGTGAGIRLEQRRVIAEAAMSFRVETYSRENAAQIQQLLFESIPAGIHVTRESEAEEVHSDARGPEPFAPLHAYAYRVSGRIHGSIEGVMEMWERIRDHDFIEIGAMEMRVKSG